MTRPRRSFASLVVLLLLLVGCTDEGTPPGVVSVAIEGPDLTLLEGDTHTLGATVVTVGGAPDDVVWSSSTPAVASVAAAGEVVAHAPGAATITATSDHDASKQDSITVTVPEPLVLVVDTNLDDGTVVRLELTGPLDVKVAWGDGNSSTTTTAGSLPHTYALEGTYEIRVSGSLPHLRLPSSATSVTGWGDVGLQSLAHAFTASEDLASVPGALPTTVTDLSYAFAGTERLNLDIGAWDVSNVTEMEGMFRGAMAFDRDLGAWDVTNVTNMSLMFQSSYFAARGLGSWDVSSVTDMSFMLSDIPFDEDIGGWDVSSVTDMSGMFSWSWFFDRDIGGWDVANVTDTSGMFEGTESFDQDIGGWDVSGVVDMDYMFSSAEAFDQDLSGWCVALIPTEPVSFTSLVQTRPLPVWGTCP